MFTAKATIEIQNCAEELGLPKGTPDATRVAVRTFWSCSAVTIDRPESHLVSCGSVTIKNIELAKRLARAIDAQACWTNPALRTDVDGNSYIMHDIKVLGRHLNADLKKLGY